MRKLGKSGGEKVGGKRFKLRKSNMNRREFIKDFVGAGVAGTLAGFVMSRHISCRKGSFETHAHSMDLFKEALDS